MIHVEVRCTTCKDVTGVFIPMECIANIKIITNEGIAHSLNICSLGGIYQCPKCKKKVDIQVRER